MSVKVHFLNVGFGDCTIVHWPKRTRSDGTEKSERIMVLDIYHSEDHDEYENVIQYYKANFKNNDGSIKPIFRFVCSHPHQDHICGLAKLFNDSDIKVLNFWDLEHEWEPEDFEGHPTHKEDWEKYQEVRSSSDITVIRTKREDTPSKYWNDEEDRITVLSPSKELIKKAHYKEDGTKRDVKDIHIDEMSYALLIKVNSRKIILAGDGRATPVWEDIYANCKSQLKNCTILKAGHHGQEASFHEDSIKEMNPELIVFSNSEACDKEDGAEDSYLKAVPNATILKTYEHGTLVAHIPFRSDQPVVVFNSSGEQIY